MDTGNSLNNRVSNTSVTTTDADPWAAIPAQYREEVKQQVINMVSLSERFRDVMGMDKNKYNRNYAPENKPS